MGGSMEAMYQSSLDLSVKLIRCSFTSPVPAGLDLTLRAIFHPWVSFVKADDECESRNAHDINVIGMSQIQMLVKIFIAQTSLPNLPERGDHRVTLSNKGKLPIHP